MHFDRSQVEILRQRLEAGPGLIQAIFGPRQTGKTTIVRQALQRIRLPGRYHATDARDHRTLDTLSDAPFVDALDVSGARDADWLVRRWEAARREAEQSPSGAVLVFDEIQKIPRWSETVKGLWDADRAADLPLHVVVLGSAPLRMQAGLSESLVGRFQPLRVTHWSFPEMAEAFNFDLPAYVFFGGYPGAAALVGDPLEWRDYILQALVEPHIERDLLAMTPVNKPALLKRLFELGAACSGEILSYDKMVGQLQDAGNTTTLARYLDLLTTAGLLAGLQKYAGRAPRIRRSSPKLNVLNTALMTAGSGYTFEEARADRTFWGRIVESAVGAHLYNTAASDTRVHYWREGSHEVDFVLQRGPNLVAIEVKSGPPRGKPRGLGEFDARFHPRRSLLVGDGGVPLAKFLAAPASRWFENP